MTFEYFIAKRYLLSKKKAGFITVITSISILGVTVGVAALVVVLSVFNGFGGLVTSLLIGFDPHLRIEGKGLESQAGVQQVTSILEHDNRVKAFSPFVASKAMAVSRTASKAVFVKGVDEESIGMASGLASSMVYGKLAFHDSDMMRGIVLGMTLSDRLGVLEGDTVMLVSPGNITEAVTQFAQPRMERFQVVGIYESHNREYDGLYAYVSLRSAQNLFNIKRGYSGVEVRTNDIENADDVKRELLAALPNGFNISTWYDLHKDLYSIMKVERWMAYIILSLIIGVATFNLLGSLMMSVIEKKRDLGVLKALGSRDRSIVRIYLIEGALVGGIGTGLGSMIGYFLCYLQGRYHLFKLDPTVYIISAIPVEIRWTDFVAVGLAAIFLSCVAALYPARRAAALVPTEAIRWE